MRVLLCCDRLRRLGGAEVHFEAVLRSAVDAGHSVALASADHRLDADLVDAEWTIKGLSSAVPGQRGVESLVRACADFDVVHAQNLMNPELLRALVASRPTVVTVQDHRLFCPGPGKTLPDGSACTVPFLDAPCELCLPDSSYRQRLEDLTSARLDALRGASQIIVLSRWMAAELTALGLVCEVIPPWVALGDDEPCIGDRFVIAGRLVRHKGIGPGIEAWRRAGRPLKLALAGTGADGAEAEDVEHLGWLDARAMRGTLRAARALILPSRWQEPFGLVAIEALAMGTPVITFDVGGCGDWSDRGCVVVPAGDIAAMAAAITDLASDETAAQRLGAQGKAMVGERFTQALLWPRLEAIYELASS